MGKIADILKTMDYGPAPEASDAVRGWLDGHKAGFGHFIGGAFTPPGELFDVHDPSTGRDDSPASRKARPPTSTPPSPPRAPRSPAGRRCPATSGRGISTRSPGSCRSASASSACWRASTTASRSARRATSTSRWSPAISITTPAGRSLIASEFPQARAGRRLRADRALELPAADAGLEGRARRSPAATPWC